MASLYNHTAELLGSGAIDWESDDIRVILVDGDYTYSAAHTFVSQLAGEITATGYARQAGANLAINRTDNVANYDLDDPEWESIATGDTIAAAVFYKHVGADGANLLIYHHDFPDPLPTNGSAVRLPVHADGLFSLTVNP